MIKHKPIDLNNEEKHPIWNHIRIEPRKDLLCIKTDIDEARMETLALDIRIKTSIHMFRVLSTSTAERNLSNFRHEIIELQQDLALAGAKLEMVKAKFNIRINIDKREAFSCSLDQNDSWYYKLTDPEWEFNTNNLIGEVKCELDTAYSVLEDTKKQWKSLAHKICFRTEEANKRNPKAEYAEKDSDNE